MRFNILSLSGGGFLGLYTARILAALEEQSGRPLRESFDLIAGTSVGGILGLGVAVGAPMRHVADLFEKAGPRIFTSRSAPKSFIRELLDEGAGLSRPKYSAEALREVIAEICGSDMTLDALKTPFLATAVNMRHGQARVFQTPLAEKPRDGALRAVDVALATSAAPTLFSAVTIGGEVYCDGGLFANSPDLVALHEAEVSMNIPIEAIHLLSIGTTTSSVNLSSPAKAEMGYLDWGAGQRIVKTMIASQQQASDQLLTGRLGQRFMRLDTEQGIHAPKLGFDVASLEARDALRQLAGETLAQVTTCPRMNAFLGHRAQVRGEE